MRRTMLDYNHYAGLGIVGEVLPQIRNQVKLHEVERDQYGLPVAHVIFSHHENDKKIVAHAKQKMKELGWSLAGEILVTTRSQASVATIFYARV